jgi:hypothetical protein
MARCCQGVPDQKEISAGIAEIERTEMKNQKIELLLSELEQTNKNQGSRCKDSRRIRRQLRSLGHYGGLRTR